MKITTSNAARYFEKHKNEFLPEVEGFVLAMDEVGWDFKKYPEFREMGMDFLNTLQNLVNESEAATEKPSPKTSLPKQVELPKPPAPKAPSPKRPSSNTANPMKVRELSIEARLARRYVKIVNNPQPYEKVVRLLKALQMAIVLGQISKKSSHSNLFMAMQKVLVKVVNSSHGGTVTIQQSEESVAKVAKVAGGEAVFPAIRLLKSYVLITGSGTASQTRIGNLIRRIEAYLKNPDGFVRSLKDANNELSMYLKGKTKTVPANVQQISGILNGCGCQSMPGDSLEGLGSLDGLGQISAEDLAGASFLTLPFEGYFGRLIGEPSARKFSMTITGKPGNGKSTLALALAAYLSANFGKALYVASEEGLGKTLQEKLQRVKAEVGDLSNLSFATTLNDSVLQDRKFVFIDSAQTLGLTMEEFKQWQAKYPNTSWVIVAQATKSGDARGSLEWQHDSDVNLTVENGSAMATKNRYGSTGIAQAFMDEEGRINLN